jgi:hypothetical protein
MQRQTSKASESNQLKKSNVKFRDVVNVSGKRMEAYKKKKLATWTLCFYM